MKIQLSVLDYEKIMFWMRKAAPNECSGFGTVSIVREGLETQLRIQEVYLLEQRNSQGSSNISPTAMGKLEYDVYRDSQAEGLSEVPGLRWWWHSHVNMEAFWSGTDKQTLLELSKEGWMSATVFNLHGEYRTCFVAQSAGMPIVMLDDLDLDIDAHVPETLKAEWTAEFDAKIKVDRTRRAPASRGMEEVESLFLHGLAEGDLVLLKANPNATKAVEAMFMRFGDSDSDLVMVQLDETPPKFARRVEGYPKHAGLYWVSREHVWPDPFADDDEEDFQVSAF